MTRTTASKQGDGVSDSRACSVAGGLPTAALLVGMVLAPAAAVLLHGFGMVSLGPHGWLWLALTLIVGGGDLLWCWPEGLWGKCAR